MNPIKAIYCRAVQAVFRTALPILPYREPDIFRSCAELSAVFSKKHIQRVLIVTDEGIVRSGIAGQLEAALDQCGVAYSVMAAHAEQEANPLYPVPRLMTREELEGFYDRVCAEGASATI